MLTPGQKANFETLQTAFADGAVCLVECGDAQTGAPVAVICAVNIDAGDYELVPFARFFDGNPYEALVAPFDGEEVQS